MPVVDGFMERIVALIKAAPSQAALAWLGGISEGTLINWKRGLGYRESDVREFCRRTGVAINWLRDGRGDADAEKSKVEDDRKYEGRLASSSRLAEDAPQYGGESSPRQKLRWARLAEGLSIPDLAKRISREASYLSALEEGIAPISERTCELLVAALPTLTKEDLMGGSDAPPILSEDGTDATYGALPKIILPPGMTGRHIPILSMAQAGGFDAGHDDGYYDYQTIFAIDVNDRKAFAITVSGNSMAPQICEGDVVVCSPSMEVKEGAATVVRTKSDQAMIKFWHRVGETVILESANEDYLPITLPIQEIAGAWPIIQRVEKRQILKQLPT